MKDKLVELQRTIFTLTASFIICSNASAAGSSHTVMVATDKGQVIGAAGEKFISFKGVPFAKPPIGSLRWMPPEPAVPWTIPRDASAFGNTCATAYDLGGFGKKSSSEDCLYLNVYVPQHSTDQKLPVMVWIHGGGLATGSGDDYDAQNLIKRGVILVTFNYRLGMFGFFSHPAINAERHAAINYGTLDQQSALKWVQKNIGAFGGDKSNVTIFGESAGGHSVLAQLVSPGAKGLFQRAIVQSGSYSLHQPSIREANQWGEQTAKGAGCGTDNDKATAACLRAAPTATILKNGVNYLPTAQVVLDGKIIPRPFIEALRTGQFARVPVINGFNQDEGTFFAGLGEVMAGRPLLAQDVKEGLNAMMGEQIGKGLYPLARLSSTDVNVGAKYAQFFGRAKFICSAFIVNQALSKHVPVYGFNFADQSAPALLPNVTFPYKAAHTSELQYLFKDFHGGTGRFTPLNGAQQQLSEQMVSYWTNFAKSGNPNGNELIHWDQFSPKTEDTIAFDTDKVRMTSNVSTEFDCGEIQPVILRPRE